MYNKNSIVIPWTTIIVLFGRHLSLRYRCVGINREGEQGRKDELKSEQIQTAGRDSQDYIILESKGVYSPFRHLRPS